MHVPPQVHPTRNSSCSPLSSCAAALHISQSHPPNHTLELTFAQVCTPQQCRAVSQLHIPAAASPTRPAAADCCHGSIHTPAAAATTAAIAATRRCTPKASRSSPTTAAAAAKACSCVPGASGSLCRRCTEAPTGYQHSCRGSDWLCGVERVIGWQLSSQQPAKLKATPYTAILSLCFVKQKVQVQDATRASCMGLLAVTGQVASFVGVSRTKPGE